MAGRNRVMSTSARIVAMSARLHTPMPHRIPTAAVTQIDAAVVSPRTWFSLGFWMMTPAPRKTRCR